MVKIWIEDFGILFNKKYLLDFIPGINMDYNEKINSIVRFSFYLSIILCIIKRNISYLYIFILTLVLTYIFYMFNKKNASIEKFENNVEQVEHVEEFENNVEQVQQIVGEAEPYDEEYSFKEVDSDSDSDSDNEDNFNEHAIFDKITQNYNNFHERSFYPVHDNSSEFSVIGNNFSELFNTSGYDPNANNLNPEYSELDNVSTEPFIDDHAIHSASIHRNLSYK